MKVFFSLVTTHPEIKNPETNSFGVFESLKRIPFFRPDCTVGSGFAPDHAFADGPLRLAGLPVGFRLTADRELDACASSPGPEGYGIVSNYITRIFQPSICPPRQPDPLPLVSDMYATSTSTIVKINITDASVNPLTTATSLMIAAMIAARWNQRLVAIQRRSS